MPLKPVLSPAALCDEASTFLLLLINATGWLMGYNTWLERSRDQGKAEAEGWAPLWIQQAGGWKGAGCRRGSGGRQILL